MTPQHRPAPNGDPEQVDALELIADLQGHIGAQTVEIVRLNRVISQLRSAQLPTESENPSE